MNDPHQISHRTTRTFRPPEEGDTSKSSAHLTETSDFQLNFALSIGGRYALQQKLGSGAFGTVYLADDTELQRQVAVKLARTNKPDPRYLELMRTEARAAARFEHPYLVRVYDFGMHDEHPYIVYEYIAGDSFQEVLFRDRLALQEKLQILSKVALAMDAAHRKGVYHRDLKPSNILIDADLEPHVTDFGLALSYQNQQDHRGEVAGTLSYMSPEQIEGKAHFLDGRADIWSLGVILYLALTDRLPFTGSREVVAEQILHRPPTPPRQINPAVPRSLEKLCLQCLSKNPEQRPSTAIDVAHGLRRHLAPWWKRLPVKMAFTAAVASLILVVVWMSLARFNRQPLSKPPVVFEPGTTYDLLKVSDPVLEFHVGKEADVALVNEQLRLITDDFALVRLGETQADEFSFRATLRQHTAQGRAGLFFGLRKSSGPNTKYVFEALELVASIQNTFLLERCCYELKTNGAYNRLVTATTPVRFNDRIDLELKVNANAIAPVTVKCNGESLDDLENRFMPIPLTATGTFGLFNIKGTSYFTDCHFQTPLE